MNRRGGRVAFAVVGTGLGVVTGLGILHWDTVRDHVEAWWFQLTTETETATPNLPLRMRVGKQRPLSDAEWNDTVLGFKGEILQSIAKPRLAFYQLGDNSSLPVIFDSTVAEVAPCCVASTPTAKSTRVADTLQILKDNGWQVIEQRFPRRAYIVLPDERAVWVKLMRAGKAFVPVAAQ